MVTGAGKSKSSSPASLPSFRFHKSGDTEELTEVFEEADIDTEDNKEDTTGDVFTLGMSHVHVCFVEFKIMISLFLEILIKFLLFLLNFSVPADPSFYFYLFLFPLIFHFFGYYYLNNFLVFRTQRSGG